MYSTVYLRLADIFVLFNKIRLVAQYENGVADYTLFY